MRIQHNIMAMSAYRNYSNNTSALSKNLTKLSSGYKINSAADDAAGLAISEKMRAQITGLDTASKNVKDGISLVQTGEGAMQEIQDMLNRMVELATESANGTYQDAVDRENLQKEVVSLQSEINRIADSANFNGIQLLDGSLASTQKITAAEVSSVEGAQVTAGATEAAKVSVAFVTGTASVNSFTGWASNDTVTLKLGSVTIATAKYTGSAWSITKGADFSGYTITFDGSTFDIAAAGKGAVTTNALTSKADGYTVTTTATSAKSSGTINGVTGYTKGADSAAEVKGKAVWTSTARPAARSSAASSRWAARPMSSSPPHPLRPPAPPPLL
jgi:flagellin